MTASTLTVPALVVPRNGGSDVLTVQDRDVPAPGPGQVRVTVAAAGINFIDIYQREGVYPIPTPFVVGGRRSYRGEDAGSADSGAIGATEDAASGRPAFPGGTTCVPPVPL